MATRAPLGTRLLKDDVAWESLTDAEVIALRERANRTRSSRAARIATGFPHRRVRIEERTLDLPGRRLELRVHRPKTYDRHLPLVLSFHGGGFILGTAAQNDWLNSRVAAACPAVVVAVEYRLAPEDPLPRPVDDGCETLRHIADHPDDWGVDPTALAVLGESAGGTIAALIALRAREQGPHLRAQVLTCPVTDWTESMTDYPSLAANSAHPGCSPAELRAARRLSLPRTMDPREVSPIAAEDLSCLPPTLVVTGALDAGLDHGRRFAELLGEAGTQARQSTYPRAVHAFLSMPGLVPAARPASREIAAFVRHHLHSSTDAATGAAR